MVGRWGWSCLRELSVWWNPSQAVNAKRTRENQLSWDWEGACGPARGTGTVAALFLLEKHYISYSQGP